MVNNLNQRQPDCLTCWKREECDKAQAGTFCPKWQSKAPKPAERDPNAAWRQGDDPPF